MMTLLTLCLCPLSAADRVGLPDMVDLNRFDIETIGGKKITEAMKDDAKLLGSVKEAFARQAVNFRYMRAAGLKAAFFQSSFVEQNDKTGIYEVNYDDSYQVWVKEAAENGVLVGAYHLPSTSGTSKTGSAFPAKCLGRLA